MGYLIVLSRCLSLAGCSQGDMMKARQLLAKAIYDPDELKIIGKASMTRGSKLRPR